MLPIAPRRRFVQSLAVLAGALCGLAHATPSCPALLNHVVPRLQDDKPQPLCQYAGKVLLVNFGYTFCPDGCPTELAAMTAAIDQLGDAAKRVQPLFITIEAFWLGNHNDYLG